LNISVAKFARFLKLSGVRVLIVGCGYLGVALGAELARQRHKVSGLRRSGAAESELRACGISPLVGDVTDPASLAKLPNSYDWVVNAISSTKGGVDEYRAVYLDGTRNLLHWLDSIGKYVFVSSTSVYAQADGSIVDENSPAEGASETSKVLVEAEALLQEMWRQKGFPALIARASGIYGPGRGHLFQQFVKGTATMVGSGERIINMIHRDDLAGAIIAALERGRSGEIYNVSDDQPVSQLVFFKWLAEELQRPLPPAEGEPSLRRKRGVTNKRVSNQKLKSELEYVLKFPTYREGYRNEIQRALEAS
jgi:nucleoside-diphosphate-sugar epimerase